MKLIFYLVLLYYMITPSISWCLRTIFASSHKIKSVDFSPDGQYIVTGSSTGKVLLWKTDTLQILKVYNFPVEVWEATFSKDQQFIAIGGAQNIIHIINALTFVQIRTIDTQHDNIVYDLDFRYDSQALITCGQDSKTKIWKVSDGSNLMTKSNKHQTYTCQFADDNKFAVAGRHYYETWDAAGTMVHQFHDGDYDDFYGLSIRPGSLYLIATNGNGDLFEASWAGVNIFHRDGVGGLYACAYSRDSTYFATGGHDGNIYMYNATNRINKLQSILKTNSTSSINSTKFSYDSNYFLAGNQNGTIYFYHRFCHGCPVGSYPNITGCRLCAADLVGCSICTNSTVCKSCQSGYYIDNTDKVCKSCDVIQGCGNCVSVGNCTSCLQGWHISGLICAKCSVSITGCFQCKSNTQCYQCESTYYVNSTTGLCQTCTTIPHCLYCNNATGCFECVAGYSQIGGSCINCSTSIANCLICSNSSYCYSCQSGYRVNSSYLCEKCMVGCLFCNSSGLCFDCAEGWYLSGSFLCQVCVFPCLSCNSSSYCRTCVLGYYISAAGVCTNCGAGCLSCNTSSRCQSCDVGYYLDTASRTCKKCSILAANCRECTPTTCLVCQLQYHINSTNCAQCSSLIPNCQICSSGTVCDHCMTGFYATGLNGSSSCQACDQVGCSSCKSSTECYACKPGYYISGLDCIQCGNNCLACTSNLTTACTSCIQGYYLSSTTSGTCLSCGAISKCTTCLNSTYCAGCAIGYFLSSPTTCTACTRPCTTCKSSTDCLTCDLGFYYYLNGSLGACSPCSAACSQCSTSGTTCLNCVQGYYHNATSQQCVTCLTTLPGCSICDDESTCILCSSGYYASGSSCLTCSNAISKCLSCDTTGSICYQCSYGFSLAPANTSCVACSISIANCQHCVTASACQTCQSGFYYSGGNCLGCNTGCLVCVNNSYCQVCSNSYTLITTTKSCSFCEDLMVGCQLCTSNTICTDCVVGYYLNASVCYLCRSAIEGCEYCSDSSHCVQCSLFYQLQGDGTCRICIEVYSGCQVCGNSSVGCTQCQISYFLDSSGTCQSCSNLTVEGCLKCSSNTTCTQCMAGYYLSNTTSLCIRCDITFPDCIYCNITSCLQCQSGYYLNNGTCSLCNNQGCQICLQTDPTKCLTCNLRYYLSTNSTCELCSTSMPQCLSCLTSSVCLECVSGFYITGTQSCALCSDGFPGCLICTPSGCLDCMANFFINSTDLHCHNCTDHIVGCAFCLSSSTCISCQNGYYSVNNTCAHCSQIPGCLYCINSSICTTCEQSYFVNHTDNSCYKCLDFIPFCYACDDNSNCISCLGHYQLLGGVCVQVKGEAVKKYKQIGLKSQYVNDTVLKHTLFARAFQFVHIDQDWPNQAELTLISQNYTRYVLTILKVQWAASSYQIYFYTNNPIADQLSQSLSNMPFIKSKTKRRLLEDSSIDLGFNLKLMLSQQATTDIMPKLGHIGDLYLDYPYSDPQFYQSYMRNRTYSYYIFGLLITILLLIGYSIKLCCLLPATKDRGSIIPHIFAVKCCALAVYPTYGEYINFCYGFMTADIPWFNSSLGGKMGNINDITPDPLKMYYTNLSIVSTYFIAVFVILFVWFCLGFVGMVCEDIKKTIEALKTMLYNFFGFGAMLAGCLSLQGTLYNTIHSSNANTVFYIIGIIIYLGIFVQIIYSFFISRRPVTNKIKAKQEDDIGKGGHLRKIRMFVKASLLSIMHFAPLYFVSAVFCIEVFGILVEYYLAKDQKANPRLEITQHFLANFAILLMILIPDALIGIVLAMALISLTMLILIYRNFCEIRQTSSLQGLQFQGNKAYFNTSQATQFDFVNTYLKKNTVRQAPKSSQGRQRKMQKITQRVWFDNKDRSSDQSISNYKG